MRYVSSMRGNDEQQGAVFSYINPEERIPAAHPLRSIRAMVDRALKELWAHFEALYGRRGRPSIPPEKLLRALLLQILYAIRSERQLMEQLDYNLLYRWFVGLNPDDAVWDVTVFTKNRERLLQGEIAQRLLEAVLAQAREQHLLSEEHFTVDGTLIEAWASRRSFGPKDPPPTVGTGVGGKKLLRDTHVSSTDPEAAVQEEHGGRGPGELSGACDHREPEGVGGGGLRHALQRDGGAGSSLTDAGGNGPQRAGSELANPSHHAGSGPAVSRGEVYRGAAPAQNCAACGRVRTQPALAELADGSRTARSRLRHQSEETQTDRESVRLGQAG